MVMEETDKQSTLNYNSQYSDHQLMYDCLVPIDVVYFSMCNKLIARRVFEKNKIRAVNGANMWEDVELAIRKRYFVKSSNVINLPFYHYNRLNSNSTTRDKTKIKINGQIERVKQIETFFYNIGEQRKYKHFLALLKLQAKKEYFDGKFAWFFKLAGCIPVDRSIHDDAAKAAALEVLNLDGAVGLFPEGTRNKTNDKFLLDFKFGTVSMAQKTGATIVPCGLTGDYKFWSKNLMFRVGKPFKVSKNEDFKDILFEEYDVEELFDIILSAFVAIIIPELKSVNTSP